MPANSTSDLSTNSPLRETSAAALEWLTLRDHLSGRTQSPLGKAHVLALEPSRDLQWIERPL